MLLLDWVVSLADLVIVSKVVERIDRFTFLGSTITIDGLVSDKISSWIQKTQLAFENLHHLWLRRDIRLPTK